MRRHAWSQQLSSVWCAGGDYCDCFRRGDDWTHSPSLWAPLLELRGLSIDRAEIEAYANTALHFVGTAHAEARREWHFPIDVEYVRSLAPERLTQPLLLVYFGAGGLLALSDDGPEAVYVLADGNHRLANGQRR